MGLIHVTVALKSAPSARKKYEADFLVDTGATDSMAPAHELKKIGIKPVGKTAYETADGRVVEFPFGGAAIEFMGEITFGRIIFGPDSAEPILGVTALESVGILADPKTQSLKRLPAIPLKSLRPLPAEKHPAALKFQLEAVSRLLRSAADFFEAGGAAMPEGFPTLREASAKIWRESKDALKDDGRELALSSFIRRIAEEASLAVLESVEFKARPPAETALMARRLQDALGNLSAALDSPGEAGLGRLLAAKKSAAEIAQIYRKARRDALKGSGPLPGLKHSELILRLFEAGELVHKTADALAEDWTDGVHGL